jgi:trimeric autotransporter adhesin
MTRNRLSKRKWLTLAAAFAGILTQSACGGGSSTSTVTSVTISPTAESVGINEQIDFSATVNLSNAATSTNTAVTWQVNGVTGGNTTVGTILASASDVQQATYTAPGAVPATDNGVVSITAIANQTSTTTTTSTSTITSNTASVTITVQLGLTVTPATTTVPAGGNFQFTAIQNNIADTNVTWAVSSTNGGDIGSIDVNSGLYTAPLFPPPGQSITVTATTLDNPPITATSTAKIVYSDASLYGPYAFSYSGGEGNAYSAVAGSFVTDGKGTILSGVEDVTSYLTGTSTQVPIFSGNYAVGSDGRTNATVNTGQGSGIAWQFTLTSNQHALMILFGKNSGGTGTIDQQNLNDLSPSDSVLLQCGSNTSCPYVFGVSGSDLSFNRFAMAGKFSVNNAGQVPGGSTILDVNDGGVVTTNDTSLNGSYTFDTSYPGTGRGTLTLTSDTTGQIKYAFYVVDSSHLKLVEIDQSGYLAGNMFSAPTAGPFSDSNLTAGNYVFTTHGTSSAGPYAAGGVFKADGSASVTAGVFDNNSNGTAGSTNASLGTCAYTTDSTTGRIDLQLLAGSGACSAGTSLNEFAMYQTTLGSAILLEIDANAVTNGVAFAQSIQPTAPPIQAPVIGSFALNLGGEGVTTGVGSPTQLDATGQLILNTSSVGVGNLDLDEYNAVYTKDPISTSTSTLVAPDTTYYRGTAVVKATDPAASYSLTFYVVDNNTALLLDTDTVRIGTGVFARQF